MGNAHLLNGIVSQFLYMEVVNGKLSLRKTTRFV